MSIRRAGAKPFDLETMRRGLAAKKGRTYWKSLDELARTAEFQDYLRHEFPENADTWTDAVGRRSFLRLMGASLAFAGLTGCTMQPEKRLVPHVRAPEEIVPGKPLFFASAFPTFGYGQGILVESHDGRPTKIEGNPLHPASLGATSIHAQASVLELYDPDRLDVVAQLGRVRTWETLVAVLRSEMERFQFNGGRGLRILTGNVTSPTLGAQLGELLERLPEARWHQYEANHRDGAFLGAGHAFGRPLGTHYRFDRAARILSLDSDFLFRGPAAVRYAKDFAAQRRLDSPTSEPNRLYMAECSPTVTGTVADHRLALRPSELLVLTRALAREFGIEVGEVTLSEDRRRWVVAAAADLRAHRGNAVVVPGEFQPPEVHALAHLMNQTLGSSGGPVVVTEPVEARPESHVESLRALVEDMGRGEVETLLILGGNPAFDAPADIPFAAALDSVPLRLHLTTHRNETSELCHWRVPESHYLEAWGDLRSFDGTVSVVQPLIEPLYRSKSACEMAAVLLGEVADVSGYDLVRRHWTDFASGDDFESWWRFALHEGFVPGTDFSALTAEVDRGAVIRAATRPGAATETFELTLRPDPHVEDGRYCNNGWLQEAPRPLTKLTWDNAVLIAPATAEAAGLAQGQVVEIRLGETSVRGPVWIQPGHPAESATVHLGYGRRTVGRVGAGTGFDAYPLHFAANGWSATGAELVPTRDRVSLASTQHHYSMEGRHLIREATLEEFRSNPSFARDLSHDPHPDELLFPLWEYPGHAWGMAVDLNACIGCNACVVACQAENNIAVVGRDQVRRGREMHWIRIDRYYAGDLDDPDTLHQPVMCQHCENAPCETVCPVAATVHSSEGLNDQVYNRCIGTRYCSNNCPYKVRRFNFLLYSDWETETLKMQRNPNVTVRSRGVMEKCTYCVQRINAAKIEAKLEDRAVRDGDVRTACQQVCPTEAIVFGDINDPGSKVAKYRENIRNYGILTELNTRPRTTYLARVRNANPELERDRES
jgi:MoCo/4Fe-4S cofactor protein with predicted Tat translocation signal